MLWQGHLCQWHWTNTDRVQSCDCFHDTHSSSVIIYSTVFLYLILVHPKMFRLNYYISMTLHLSHGHLIILDFSMWVKFLFGPFYQENLLNNQAHLNIRRFSLSALVKNDIINVYIQNIVVIKYIYLVSY